MRLMHGKLSPYVRKVMVAVAEKGLEASVEIVPTAVGQGKVNAELLQLNPTGKIPTLVTDDGESLYDSLVIIDFLDELQPTPLLIPRSGAERRRALRLNAVGDGLLLAAGLAKIEAGRPPEKQWPEFMAAQWAKVTKCLEVLDRDLAAGGTGLTLGEISAGCALGWLEARAPEHAWKPLHPGLAEWFATFAARPSMRKTQPVA